MYIQQFYTKCLAEASYYIESNGYAAIIDPLRDIQPYLELLHERKAQLKYVLETHFHADFVSGHVDLANATHAQIIFGPGAAPQYPCIVATDNQFFTLGQLHIKVLHTPGHTLESSCFLIIDEHEHPHVLFSGDTLFVGDVGRPDLVQKVKAEITPEYLAGLMFDSLRNKIMPLHDDIVVYPGHGAGSACGKNLGSENQSTIGKEKATNYALNTAMTRDTFIAQLLDGLTEPPIYFPQNVLRNINGNECTIGHVIENGSKAFSVETALDLLQNNNAIIIDTRTKEDFWDAHLPNSIFVGLDDNFAPWLGTVIPDINSPIILVTYPGKEEEAIVRMARIGFDHCLGYINEGSTGWNNASITFNTLDTIEASQFPLVNNVEQTNFTILDVRRKAEFELGHIEGAINMPLEQYQNFISKLNKDTRYYVYCAAGYRSTIFLSLLLNRGFTKVTNIIGGYKELSNTALSIVTLQKEFI